MVVKKKKVVKKVKKAKKKIPRSSEGYIVMYTRNVKRGYYSYSEKTTKIIICKDDKALKKALLKYGQDFAGKGKPKVSRTLPMEWSSPTHSIVIIKGKVLPVKIETEVNVNVPKTK